MNHITGYTFFPGYVLAKIGPQLAFMYEANNNVFGELVKYVLNNQRAVADSWARIA